MIMASKPLLIIAIMVILAAAPPCLATDYVVGDESGWRLGVNYTQWATGKRFFVGDTILFNYKEGFHSVYKVNESAFQNCLVPPPSEALTSGKDSITLAGLGKKWFLCGVGKHCTEGMKLEITVMPSSGN